MIWDSEKKRKFREILQRVYRSYDQLQIFVMASLGLNLEVIVKRDSLEVATFSLIEHLESNGKLGEFYDEFCVDNPRYRLESYSSSPSFKESVSINEIQHFPDFLRNRKLRVEKLAVAESEAYAASILSRNDSNPQYSLYLHDLEYNFCSLIKELNYLPLFISMSPNGKKILLANSNIFSDSEIFSIEGKLLQRIKSKPTLSSCCWSSDSHYLAVAHRLPADVSVWDLIKGQRIADLSGHRWCAESLVFSQSSLKLFSTGLDGLLKQWDVDTGRCLRTWGDNDYSELIAGEFIAWLSPVSPLRNLIYMEPETSLFALCGKSSEPKQLRFWRFEENREGMIEGSEMAWIGASRQGFLWCLERDRKTINRYGVGNLSKLNIQSARLPTRVDSAFTTCNGEKVVLLCADEKLLLIS